MNPTSYWILDGEALWVTGWGHVDAMELVARGPDDESVVSCLFETEDQPGLTVTRQRLVAADASCTVRLQFDGVRIPAEKVLRTGPRVDPSNSFSGAHRVNASLALGVAGRCCLLIGPSGLDDELAAVREALDAAQDDDQMDDARAAASAFAAKAAAALGVHTGSASVGLGHHAQRLAPKRLCSWSSVLAQASGRPC